MQGVTSTGDGDIDGATSNTYKPKAGDVGGTLTATASYFDGESAAERHHQEDGCCKARTNAVELDTRNKAPVFGDEDPDTDGVQNTMATRKVEENTEALAGATGTLTQTTTPWTDDNSADNVGAAVDGHRHQGQRLSRDADLQPGRGRCGQVPGAAGQRPDRGCRRGRSWTTRPRTPTW